MNKSVLWLTIMMMSGCDSDKAAVTQKSPPVKSYEYLTYLPAAESPMDILVDDLNRDGRKDIAVTLHALNASQIFLQESTRKYWSGGRLAEFGFHPGDWVRWPVGGQPQYVAAAEGINGLINFQVNGEGKVEKLSKLSASRPRNLAAFTWPDWGWSLVTTPFETGTLEFFKGYDPGKGNYAERLMIGLSGDSGGASIRRVERVYMADINNDGIDELLLASHTTGEILEIAFAKDKKHGKPKVEKIFDLGDNSAPRQVLAKDLNGDNAVDLLVPDQTEPYQIHVMLNDGKGKFRETLKALPFAVKNGLRYADLREDHDDMRYLAVIGYGAMALYQLPKIWDGIQPIPMRWVKISERGMSSDIVLEDMDGDGWLDVVLGYVSPEHCVAVIHGPLWQHVEELAHDGYMLD